MTPTPGQRIGSYEFTERVGAGGMGEIWRARDMRLERTVAIKTLPPEFAAHRDRLARLRREAQLLAALNHPNIAAIHGLEEDAGTPFLVLEFIEGETLEDRLQRGRIPLHDTLEIARQIAAALESAHDHGIVHRDLKPANIKFARDGRVKVLDFGLAKPLDADRLAMRDAATVTRAGEPGLLLGTPAYMSPEQARGESVDARTDIWAFGVILAEMLTGRALFQGSSAPETLARVVDTGPVELELPAATPLLVGRLVRRCLRRHPAERLRHIGDARLELDDAIGGESLGIVGSGAASEAQSGWSRRRVVASVGLGVAAAGGGWLVGRGRRSELRIEHYDIASQTAIAGFHPRNRLIAISPDGLQIAYAGLDSLQVRSILSGTSAVLGRGAEPFFAPDGKRVAYFSAGGELLTSSLDGSEQTVVASFDNRYLGGSWSADGRIFIALEDGLFVVPADGSAAPELLVAPDTAAGELFGWPEVLPGSRGLLFTILPADPQAGPHTAVLDLESGTTMPVTRGERARYLSTGHLLVADRGGLLALDFDVAAMSARSEPRQLDYALSPSAPNFDVAQSGTLIYMPPTPGVQWQNVWVDPATGREEAASLPRFYIYPRFDKEGKRLVSDGTSQQRQRLRKLFVYDFERGIEITLTTDAHEDLFANWGPDGETVYFNSKRGQSNMSVFAMNAYRSDSPRLIYSEAEYNVWLMQVVPARGTLLLAATRAGEKHARRFLEVDIADPTVVTEHPAIENGGLNPVISARGDLIAYQSNETGRTEIWVRSLDPNNEQKRQVSPAGGRNPAWSADGSMLYFQDFAGAMRSAEVRFGAELSVGIAREVFPNANYIGAVAEPLVDPSGRQFDIGTGGRMLIAKARLASPGVSFSVVLDFARDL